ncbi:hypothetical protein DFP75_101125 [Marinomonas alcarazii]|uniref:Uncharacterized protein n=1 Tax=Marinomonas alcarazii TaxID=491949 RepID=A0A318V873_9GAMM|nr:hypothetical protein [Marinomonas alcarazii]PYF84100.1 hypothetical protein DFP75_101125 [Marinomonas alcarazii]
MDIDPELDTGEVLNQQTLFFLIRVQLGSSVTLTLIIGRVCAVRTIVSILLFCGDVLLDIMSSKIYLSKTDTFMLEGY